jgi:hypothetical protein
VWLNGWLDIVQNISNLEGTGIDVIQNGTRRGWKRQKISE